MVAPCRRRGSYGHDRPDSRCRHLRTLHLLCSVDGQRPFLVRSRCAPRAGRQLPTPALTHSPGFAKNAALDTVAGERGLSRPLPQRVPVGVEQLRGRLPILDDVAELLEIDRIDVVRAYIEHPVV